MELKLVGNILGSSLMASKYSAELTNLNYKEGMSNDKKSDTKIIGNCFV